MCFSVRYLVRPSSALFLMPPDAKTGDNYQVDADPMDAVPNTPGREGDYVKMLRAEPNIYIAPNNTSEFEANTGDKYAIPRADISATLAMYAYPCAKGAGVYLKDSVKLAFPPA